MLLSIWRLLENSLITNTCNVYVFWIYQRTHLALDIFRFVIPICFQYKFYTNSRLTKLYVVEHDSLVLLAAHKHSNNNLWAILLKYDQQPLKRVGIINGKLITNCILQLNPTKKRYEEVPHLILSRTVSPYKVMQNN